MSIRLVRDMSSDAANTMKDQRDRFLGFAFAGADMLLEVDTNNYTVLYSVGAVKGVTGTDDSQLNGSDFLQLFAARDHALVKALKNRARIGQRFGPVLVNLKEYLNDLGKTQNRTAMLSGLILPTLPDRIYFTLGKSQLSQTHEASMGRDVAQGQLLEADQFADAAVKMMESGDTAGTKLGMTFIDLPGTEAFKKKLGAEQWSALNENITGVLRAYAADGKTAARLENGRFGVVHEAHISADQIARELEAVSTESDPEKRGLTAKSQTVDMADDTLSDHEMAKAMVYTINKFASKSGDFDITSLKSGFEDFLGQNAQQISQYKNVINQQRFDLKFQPIVNLKTGDVAYHEVLVRFEGGASPFAAIEFIEDVGLSPELDLAICTRALNYLIHNNRDKNLKLSINLSGVSVQNKRFISKLRSKLEPLLKTEIPKQVIFEITESSEIKDLDQVNEFIKALQDDGFKVALDDFGAGSASFQYLQKLEVDAVKIDGQYVSAILDSKRDETMIKNLVHLCQDLDIQVVAERVETRELATMLKNMGVDYGQGYYFAKPMDQPAGYTKKPF